MLILPFMLILGLYSLPWLAKNKELSMSAMSPGHNHDVTNVWLVPLTTLCWWNTPAFIWDPAFIGTWASEPRRL